MKKRFNGFSTKCYKVKKPSRQSGVVVSFLSNKVSGDEAFVCKDTYNLAKNVFQSFFLVKNDQTKNMKIEETASAILGDTLFQICFLIEIA